MDTTYSMSDSDSKKILSVVKFFEEIYPNFDCFVSSYSITGATKELNIIETLSSDLSKPLSGDLLIWASDLFDLQGVASELVEDMSIQDWSEKSRRSSYLNKIEDLFFDFFIALEKEAEKRK